MTQLDNYVRTCVGSKIGSLCDSARQLRAHMCIELYVDRYATHYMSPHTCVGSKIGTLCDSARQLRARLCIEFYIDSMRTHIEAV